MKVREAIKERIGQYAKIGSGAGFVWCGEITDDLPNILDKLSEGELKRLAHRLKKLESHMYHFENTWGQKLEKQMDGLYKIAHAKKWSLVQIKEQHQKILENHERNKAKDMQLTERAIKMLTKALEERKPFPEREVEEIYPSLEKGEIIIFEGCETGRYWLYEEYEEENR